MKNKAKKNNRIASIRKNPGIKWFLLILVLIIILAVGFRRIWHPTTLTATPTIQSSSEAVSLELPALYPKIDWVNKSLDHQFIHFSGVYNDQRFGGDLPISGQIWEGRVVFNNSTENEDVENYYQQQLGNQGWLSKLSIDGTTLDERVAKLNGPCDSRAKVLFGLKGQQVRIIRISRGVDPCVGDGSPIPPVVYLIYQVFISDPISTEAVKAEIQKTL